MYKDNISSKYTAGMDAFWDAVPEDPYGMCPCGCGKKFRFVVRGGEKEIERHESDFIEKYKQEKSGE